MSITAPYRFRYHSTIVAFACILGLVYLAFTATLTRHQAQAAAPKATSASVSINSLGADGPVSAIAGDGDYVYAGGSFHTIGGVSASGVARLNVKTGLWTTLGTGTTSTGNGVGGFV